MRYAEGGTGGFQADDGKGEGSGTGQSIDSRTPAEKAFDAGIQAELNALKAKSAPGTFGKPAGEGDLLGGFTPEQVGRLTQVRNGLDPLSEQMGTTEASMLRFTKWLVEHGRIGEGDQAPS